MMSRESQPSQHGLSNTPDFSQSPAYCLRGNSA
jgi:hypothetical protein